MMGLANRPLPTLQSALYTLMEIARSQGDVLPTETIAELSAALEPAYQDMQSTMQDAPGGWQSAAMKFGYMTYRASLPFASNVVHILDPDRRNLTALERAALVIRATYKFFQAVNDDALEPDTVRGDNMDMSRYQTMFGATRMPRHGIDEQKFVYGTDDDVRPRCILFCNRGRMFDLPVERLGPDGWSAMEPNELLAMMTMCVKSPATAEGVLLGTSMPRESWAEWQEHLRKRDENRKTFAVIERSLFVVAYDEEHAVTLNDQIVLARDSNHVNRYYDKAVQWIVFADGGTALNFEHSFFDGANAVQLCHSVFHWSHEIEVPTKQSLDGYVPRVLEWCLDDSDFNRIRTIENEVADHQRSLVGYSYTDSLPAFGKGILKDVGVSVDTLFQMALQLTSQRVYGRVLPVNEAVQMRHFAGGRYDTILCATVESRAWAAGWDVDSRDSEASWRRFEVACNSIRKRVRACKEGHGGILVLTTLFALREEMERVGRVGDGWQLSAFWNAHPWLHDGLYCKLITSNPGAALGVRKGAFTDVGNRIGVMYEFVDDTVRVHATFYGEFATSITLFRQALVTAVEEIDNFVAENLGLRSAGV